MANAKSFADAAENERRVLICERVRRAAAAALAELRARQRCERCQYDDGIGNQGAMGGASTGASTANVSGAD